MFGGFSDEIWDNLTNFLTPLQGIKTTQTNMDGLTQDQYKSSATDEVRQLNGGVSIEVPDNFGVRVKCPASNSSEIYVGDSGVTPSNGFRLAPNSGLVLYVNDVSVIYAHIVASGDKVEWIFEV